MGFSREQSTSNFPKNEHFLPPDTHTCQLFPHWILIGELVEELLASI